MKIFNGLYKIVIIFILLTMYTSQICYANDLTEYMGEMGVRVAATTKDKTIKGDPDKGLPTLDDYSPTLNLNTNKTDEDGNRTAMTIISTILGFLQVLGIISVVIGLALIGFNSILGSAEEKAEGQEKYLGIVVAALLIGGGSTIAKFLINFAEKL